MPKKNVTYEALFFDADHVCVDQVRIEARNYKEATEKARKLPEMGRADVASFDVARAEQ